MKPDLKLAARFLEMLDPEAVFTFQTFGDKTKNSALNRVLHGTLVQHAAELVRLNGLGAGVFVMVNKGDGVVHAGEKTSRATPSVVAVRSLFVDLDGSPIEPVTEAILPPDLVVESSACRWHAYWLVHGCPLDQFTQKQKSLAQKFAGDMKICDLPRVMRLPGFFHQKGDPFMTRLVLPE